LLFSVVFYLLASTCEILKGDKPAYLPFQLAEIELIINLKTAETLGASLSPPRSSGRTDEVVKFQAALCLLLAQLGPSAMSAIRSLSGAKRTLSKPHPRCSIYEYTPYAVARQF
jgi:hypothetical protein